MPKTVNPAETGGTDRLAGALQSQLPLVFTAPLPARSPRRGSRAPINTENIKTPARLTPSKRPLDMFASIPRRRTGLSPQLALKLSYPRRSSSLPPRQNAPVIFSGIQPTGVPHLGNYLGAVREWVRLQNDSAQSSKLLFSIVDLHALTVPQDAARLKSQRREMFATLLAAGLDPKQSTIFYQSAVCDAVLRPRLLCINRLSAAD
jgi:hypothetical protein